MASVSRLQKRSLMGHNDLERMFIYSFVDKLHYTVGVLPLCLGSGVIDQRNGLSDTEGEAHMAASSLSS